VILLFASVNFVAHSSMEVGVKVLAEDPNTGERRHTSSAYLTFVALEGGRPVEIPPVIPETAEESRRYREAGERRARRVGRLREKRSRRTQP
jgi:acyl-CoA hydrolase